MFISGKSVADELRTLRDRKNLTAEEVSKTIGIHPNTLYKYEKDASNMPLEILEKILNYYEIDELIFFKIIREYNHN